MKERNGERLRESRDRKRKLKEPGAAWRERERDLYESKRRERSKNLERDEKESGGRESVERVKRE